MASSAEDLLFQEDETIFTPIEWGRTSMEWRGLIASPYCDLPATHKHILTVMSRYGKKDGEDIFPSQREIAFRAGTCKGTVNGAMKKAEREGWIIRRSLGHSQGYKRHLYKLAIPVGIADATACMKARFFDPPYKYEMVRHEDRIELVSRTETC